MDNVPSDAAAMVAGGAPRPGPAGREFKKLGFSLYVSLSDDKLECRCSYVPHQQGSMLTLDELRGYLDESGVKEGILQEALDDFAAKAAAGQALTMVLLAAGTPPVAGRDGHLSYIAQSSVIVTHDSDEPNSIDLHNVQTFINVRPDDEIARIVPAEPGLPGKSVTGQTIPPQPGKPLNLKIGNNIRSNGDGELLVAETAGRVCLVGGEISVAEEYVVTGDVNFRIGSIVFNGFVEVRGDVLDGFSITALKGLRVNGNIGACDIKSDGDIAFCGMDGREKGSIVCGGSISANFMHDCAVECAGDVTIDVELHNCHIRTLGKIIVNKGAIAGGSYTALGGIETKKAGSPASVKTTLRAGIDYHDMAEWEQILAELEKNSVQAKQTSSFQELEAVRKSRAELTDRLMAIRSKADEHANPKINVKGVLYDNTYLCVGMVVKEKTDEREGPFSAIENTIDGGVRFTALTGLAIKAGDIEQAFVREQALKRLA